MRDAHEGWMVGIRTDALGRYDTIVIGRDRYDHVTEYITGLGTGFPEIVQVSSYEVSPTDAEFVLPRGVLQAIAEHVKPGAAQGEVKRLEEALTLERSRVEKLIDTHLHRPSDV